MTSPRVRLRPPTSETLDYDEDGNLTETAEWDYTWDAENRLIAAEQKSLSVASGLTAPARKKLEFAYDSKNRRIAKVVYEWRTVGGTPQWALTKDLRFVYDGWQMIAELDHTFATGTGLAGSAVNRTFLWGLDLSGSMTGAGGVGGLLSTTYQGITYQACSDANGNVTGLVPVSGTGAGTLVARFDYDPFGNRLTNAGPSVELCPLGFSSKYLDNETKMAYFGFRYCFLESGRWLNRDPIGEKGGINLVVALNNDCLNRVDYLGMFDTFRTGFGAAHAAGVKAIQVEYANALDAYAKDKTHPPKTHEHGGRVCCNGANLYAYTSMRGQAASVSINMTPLCSTLGAEWSQVGFWHSHPGDFNWNNLKDPFSGAPDFSGTNGLDPNKGRGDTDFVDDSPRHNPNQLPVAMTRYLKEKGVYETRAYLGGGNFSDPIQSK